MTMTETRQEVVKQTGGRSEVIEARIDSEVADQTFIAHLRGAMPDLVRPSRSRERRIAMYDQAYAGESAFPKRRVRKPVQP